MDASGLTELRSKQLFGQAHRLAVMIAVAHSKDGTVNPTDLSFQLGLSQSAFQAPLRDLEAAGLLTRRLVERRNYYVRQPSLAWDWVLELEQQITKEAAQLHAVTSLRSS